MKKVEFETGSFRDRNSRVFYQGDSVLRALSAHAFSEWRKVSQATFFRRRLASGDLVGTEAVEGPREIEGGALGSWAGFLKHDRIPFVSYPYEWSFNMLKDAALLQLDLLRAALEEGFILKDASAYNVQWRGSRPVFIDIPSFEELRPRQPWTGYRQFCQLNLYPLFLQAYKDVPFQPWLRGSIDGIEPEECWNLMSLRDLLRRGVFAHVYLHAKMQARYQDRPAKEVTPLQDAAFDAKMIETNVARVRKVVAALEWRRGRTEWSDYADNNSYSADDREAKESFVHKIASSHRWRLTWDLGCNVGNFSRIAAEHSDYVVAIDGDALAIDRLYRSLRKEGRTDILPLIGNLADPAPNLGWRGLERKSLVERGRPELTLCLALIHHLVITANLSLREVLDWLAALGTDLVIEFVAKGDPMVDVLLRNKVDDYADYELPLFERWLGERFEVRERQALANGTRFLFHASARSE